MRPKCAMALAWFTTRTAATHNRAHVSARVRALAVAARMHGASDGNGCFVNRSTALPAAERLWQLRNCALLLGATCA